VAAETGHAAEAGQRHDPIEPAVQGIHRHLAGGVLHESGHQAAAQQAGELQRLGGLGQDLAPGGALGPTDVDGDDTAPRGVQVRLEVEHIAHVAQKRIAGLELREQLHDGAVGLGQFLVEKPVPDVGSLPDGNAEKPAILGHAAAEAPLLLILAFVHKHVCGLQRAPLVVVQLLEVVLRLQFALFIRGVVAAVEKARAVLRPGGAGELHPLDEVRQVVPGDHVADAPLGPVGAAAGDAVGDPLPVRAHGVAGQRHGAVRRPGVRIDEHPRRRVERIGGVEHRLVLQAVVAGVEVPSAFPERNAETLVVPEPGQALADLRSGRNPLEVAEGDLVFRLDPGAGLRRVRVLEPAVRIGDFHAVVVVHRVTQPRRRVFFRGVAVRSGRPDRHECSQCQDQNKAQSHNGAIGHGVLPCGLKVRCPRVAASTSLRLARVVWTMTLYVRSGRKGSAEGQPHAVGCGNPALV